MPAKTPLTSNRSSLKARSRRTRTSFVSRAKRRSRMTVNFERSTRSPANCNARSTTRTKTTKASKMFQARSSEPRKCRRAPCERTFRKSSATKTSEKAASMNLHPSQSLLLSELTPITTAFMMITRPMKGSKRLTKCWILLRRLGLPVWTCSVVVRKALPISRAIFSWMSTCRISWRLCSCSTGTTHRSCISPRKVARCTCSDWQLPSFPSFSQTPSAEFKAAMASLYFCRLSCSGSSEMSSCPHESLRLERWCLSLMS
mmetsp:Transcript_115394/g.372864  ORF Transcript_115394/g.372864 Transcript_115394/m.372864 type:complete len:259 (+) Transcript_115394:976-1752(+)